MNLITHRTMQRPGARVHAVGFVMEEPELQETEAFTPRVSMLSIEGDIFSILQGWKQTCPLF